MSTPTVFLSYAREDASAAQRLYSALVSAGTQVWFDQECLAPGARWETTIRQAIRESRHFVCLFSSRSVGKQGFVNREIREALEILDTYPDTEIYFIPVRLDHCSPSHERVRELNWVDLFPDWEPGMGKLLRFFSVQRSEQPSSQHGVPATDTLTAIRSDGLYRSERGMNIDANYYHYLRFYKDGTVLAATTTGTPSEIVGWFTPENAYISKGALSVSGNTVRFSATSPAGTVDYEGTVEASGLILRSHSHINGYRAISEYRFQSVAQAS